MIIQMASSVHYVHPTSYMHLSTHMCAVESAQWLKLRKILIRSRIGIQWIAITNNGTDLLLTAEWPEAAPLVSFFYIAVVYFYPQTVFY